MAAAVRPETATGGLTALPLPQLQRIAETAIAVAAPAHDRPIVSGDRPPERGVVRSLTVALDPAALGGVTVSLRLSGGAMTLEIAAERDETARLIEEDRTLLQGLIEAGDSEVEIAAIDVQRNAPATAPSQSLSADAPKPYASGSSGSGDMRGDQQQGRQRSPEQRDQPKQSHWDGTHETKTPERRAGGSLYV